jgi:twinkle protein
MGSLMHVTSSRGHEDGHRSTSNLVRHEPCPSCGSRNNLARYTDGHGWCFGCGHYESGDTMGTSVAKEQGGVLSNLSTGTVTAIPNRRLDEDTCRLFNYQVGGDGDNRFHIAPYRDRHGRIVSQKIRKRGKEFSFEGDTKAIGLFGDHLWSSGKKIVVTEGEIDCMSVSQAQGNRWPCVSIPNGAQGAAKAIQKSYDYLNTFEEIILMFDMDDPGRKASIECAEILPVGKVKIASLPYKDANECLVNGRPDAIISAIWNAKPYRPDGIVSAKELKDLVMQDDGPMGFPYPFSRLNEITRGIRSSELVVITSGSGMGKTTFVREVAYALHRDGKKVGMIMLEESNKRTLQGLVGLHLNKNILVDRSLSSDTEISSGFDELFGSDDIALYDHFGSTDVDNILNRIRYMARALGCTHVIVDHISILVSGIASGDERKLIDMAMTKLRTLVQETGITLFVVSHLKRPEGNLGHEDGAKVHLGQLRGSHAIAQLADICVALQKPDADAVDSTELRVLKNRFTGEVGNAGTIFYNRETGRLTEGVF